MNTQLTTRTLVRDDVATPAGAGGVEAPEPGRVRGRLWAATGPAAVVAYLVGSVAAGLVDPVYDPARSHDPDAVMAGLAEGRVGLTVFHVLTTLAGLLLIVFSAGLVRRLRDGLRRDSLIPTIAGGGLLLTAATQVIGSGLDTELIEGVARPESFVAETAVLYGHWIGTIPFVWVTAGVTALAVAHAALRARALPRWIGVVSLILGGLTVLAGISPLQYVAGMTGPLWVLVAGTGLVVGDRAFARQTPAPNGDQGR